MHNQNNNLINNLSLILQALSLEILFKDYNNADLMQELQKQDREYLDKIIKQNNEILSLLRKEDTYGRQSNRKNNWKY